MVSVKTQQGQALLAVLAFTVVLAIALVYLFNSSNLLAERAQAKVLADHAAYNTATKHAQLLNANAYMNKAKLTNQLATAQAVSVGSWAEHFTEMPDNTEAIKAIPYAGQYIHQGIEINAKIMEGISYYYGLTRPVYANGMATSIISAEQAVLNRSAIATIQKEHEYTQQLSSIGRDFKSEFMPKNLEAIRFISHYQGDDRARIKSVLMQARDAFSAVRRAKPTKYVLPYIDIHRNRLEHRGGTELSDDMNQWKGVDTLSHHYRTLRRLRWRHHEIPIGYGSALARSDGDDSDSANRIDYQGAASVNRRANQNTNRVRPNWDARDSHMMGEHGVPQYWDLSRSYLSQAEPSMDFSIKITKSVDKLKTTTGASALKVGKMVDVPSEHAMTAVSTAQVYFERPLQDREGRATHLNSGKYEKASLFNPYWQVRLVDNTTATMAQAGVR